ncbi:unnamed protein product [Darwinula stevensoni]|uniref:Uncharacterized protein n=1 Tax=Darwinula stevensoni TaxID=69355 RepID=A0A7R9ACD3_9CRUS|nr:unnamed protein product [Darwinula stevensoni]CAG0899736.1 unnamed protein product [Darwinula stevensoni]
MFIARSGGRAGRRQPCPRRLNGGRSLSSSCIPASGGGPYSQADGDGYDDLHSTRFGGETDRDQELSDKCTRLKCGLEEKCVLVDSVCPKPPCSTVAKCVEKGVETCATLKCPKGTVCEERKCVRPPCDLKPKCVFAKGRGEQEGTRAPRPVREHL